MSRSLPRRWLIRALQLSPLLALSILAGVWFSVPPGIAPQLASTAAEGERPVTPKMRRAWIDASRNEEVARQLGIDELVGTTDSVLEGSWSEWADSLPPDLTEADVLSPEVSAGDGAVFSRVSEWERRSGGRVWAWIVPAPPRPSLEASASGDPYSLNLLRSEFKNHQQSASNLRVPEAKGLEEWLWWQSTNLQGRLRPLGTSLLQPEGGGGYGGGGMFLTSYTLRGSRNVWLAVVEGPAQGADQSVPVAAPKALLALDPDAPGLQRRIGAIASEAEVNIWLFGPLELTAVPLRIPAGTRQADARELGATVWPSMGGRDQNTYPVTVSRLGSEARRMTGGTVGLLRLTGMDNSSHMGGAYYGLEEVPPPTVAWLAVFDGMPTSRPSALSATWSSWQGFVSGWFPFALGAAVALLALTLVLSPVAFVYERRLIARERVQEEMARMRRDAHDKVYNRLSALSKRVAVAGDKLAADNAAALSAIAEDIRGTVGELQEILGDEVEHGESVLTNVPLAEQIGAVCRAQGARLGVEVECGAEPDLPMVAPAIGWDLQCVVEETISNAVRHGAATKIAVTLRIQDDHLVAAIADNGRGSVVTSPAEAAPGSQGLRGIEHRIARHGGNLDISTRDAGTTVTVRLPVARVSARG